MSLSGAMSAAFSGLRAVSRQSDLTSNNVANAGTDGFVRKGAVTDPIVVAGRGGGTRVAEIRRFADPVLAEVERRETAAARYLEVQAEALGRLSDKMGDPADERSLAAAMGRLEASFINLADAPESAAHRQDVLTQADGVLNRFHDLSETVRVLRQEADAAIDAEVSFINTQLQDFDRVETELSQLRGRGRDTTALEDQRDAIVAEIGERLPVRTLTDESGRTMLLTTEGLPLYDSEPAQLTFARSPTIPATSVYDPSGALGAGYSHNLSGLTLNGQEIAPGSGGSQSIRSGSIAGYFAVRDDALRTAQRRLDDFAAGFVGAFEAAESNPAGPGLFVDGKPGPTPGLSARIELNPTAKAEPWRLRDGVQAVAEDTVNVSSSTQVLRYLSAFESELNFTGNVGLPSELSLRQAGSEIIGIQQIDHGQLIQRTESQLALSIEISTAHDNSTGVNIDGELQKLLFLEQTYAANAQVLQAASRMLDDLLSIG